MLETPAVNDPDGGGGDAGGAKAGQGGGQQGQGAGQGGQQDAPDSTGPGMLASAAVGWAFLIWGLGMYLWAFVLYLVQVTQVVRQIPKAALGAGHG